MSDKKPERVLAYIRDHAWSILPSSLETIIEIASRTNDDYKGLDVEALSAKLGKRLEKTERAEMRGNVGVLAVEGPLFRYANMFTMFSGATSYEQLATDFNAMLDNPNVKSIVLNINSPGGQTDGANEFAGMVYAARGKKKITAYVSHLGASAAYLIASAADEIVLEAMAAVGSIGTVARVQTSKEKDVMEIVSSQSPNKRPDVTKDEGKAQIQGYVDALAQVFIDTVATHRGISSDTVLKDYGQGGVLVGAQAVKAGMADKIGTFESVIATQEETNMTTKTAILLSAVTLAMLREERPDLCAELKSEGIAEGKTTECARIKAVSEQSLPGHDKLIAEAMFDGKSTASDVAVKILAAEKTARATALDKARQEAPAPAAPSAAAPAPAAPAAGAKKAEIDAEAPFADVKASLKAEWDADKDLRAEFQNDLDTYTSFRINEAKGKVRFFKKPEAKTA